MIDENLTGSPVDAGGEMFATRKKFVNSEVLFGQTKFLCCGAARILCDF